MRALHTSQDLPALRGVVTPAFGPSMKDCPAPTSFMGLLFTTLGAGYFSIDRNYKITDTNAPALKWLNMSRRMVVGRPFSEILPQSPMRMLKAAVEEKIFVDRRLPSYQKPDRTIDLHIYPTDLGAILFFKDMTDNELQQEDDVRTKLLLQSALDALGAHVVVLDGTGTVVASNAAWQKFATTHGLRRPGAKRLNYLALYAKPLAPRRDAIRIGEMLTSVIGGRRQTARVVHTWPLEGRVHWFQLNAARFECRGETYVVVANEDVTAVKEAQQASGEMAERLLTLQEEERQRIAEELHDSTAQHLVSIGLNIMKLKSKLPASERCSDLFNEIDACVQETSKELRTFTYLLHPPRLDEDGLHATAEHYAQGFARRTGLKMTVRVTPVADAVPFELQRCLFRIMQEGLTNIHRHALASNVRLDLRYLGQQLHLVVRDDGVGMDTAESTDRAVSVSSMGVGIPGMRARLRQFGGELSIRSASPGTCLHAIVPFIPDAPECNGHGSPYINGLGV